LCVFTIRVATNTFYFEIWRMQIRVLYVIYISVYICKHAYNTYCTYASTIHIIHVLLLLLVLLHSFLFILLYAGTLNIHLYGYVACLHEGEWSSARTSQSRAMVCYDGFLQGFHIHPCNYYFRSALILAFSCKPRIQD
jgi:hypothetical protein